MAASTRSSDYKLTWDVRGQTPFRVNYIMNSVASVGDRVYFMPDPKSDVVYEYLSTTGEWQKLPPCGVNNCALTNVQGNLTTVGGACDGPGQRCSDCLCWDEASRSWTSHYPPVPGSCFYRPIIATTVGHLIAADCAPYCTDMYVMDMNVNARHWSTVAEIPADKLGPLPHSVAVCNGTVYVVYMYSTLPPVMYYCSLDVLLQSTPQQSVWQFTEYPDSPRCIPTPITVNNILLSIQDEAVLMYKDEQKTFMPVKSMPVLSHILVGPTVCTLPGGRILLCTNDNVILIGTLLHGTAEEEERHLAAFRAVMAEKGSLEQTIMHCLLFGYPGVGKSSLLKRLRGHPPDPTLPSTGVAEKAVQVEIRRLTTTTAMVLHTTSQHGAPSTSKWCTLSYDDEAIALMSTASRGTITKIAQPTTSHDSSPTIPTSSLEAAGEGSKQPVLVETFEPTDSPNQLAGSKSTSVIRSNVQHESSMHLEPAIPSAPSDVETEDPSIHALMPAMEVLKQAIKRTGLEGVARYLQHSLTLYITDTGGQLEFQELLPALTAGPTLFFLVFRLDQDLDKTISIQYRHPEGHSTNPYQSSFTVRESLLQSLASIASMGSYIYSKKQIEPVLLKPKVIFIGTHRDKVSTEKMLWINHHLREMVKATSLYHEGLIERVSETQLMVAVNNLSADDTHFQCVQSIVERIADRDSFRVCLPTSWLIFSLVIRRLKRRIITYAECFTIGLQYGIDSKEELNEALWFLNTKVGLVRHFRGEGLEDLQDIVIVDPQVIFTKITRLIVSTFTDEHVTANVCDEFKSKGIFPRSVLERINSEDGVYELLTVDRFVKLLEHLHIISRLHTEEVKYFMPCTLAHAQSTAPELTHSSSAAPFTYTQQIPPLLFTFWCGYCPKGLFSALVVYLLANKMKLKLDWLLETEQIYRNAISFLVGPYDTITLTLTSKYLEVAVVPALVERERLVSVEAVCNEVRHCVETAVQEVTSSLHYTSDAEHALAFYCTGRHEAGQKCHPAEVVFYQSEPCCIRCGMRRSKRPLDLPSGYQQWFGKGLCPEITKKRKQSTVEEEKVEGESPLKLARTHPEPFRNGKTSLQADEVKQLVEEKESEIEPGCGEQSQLSSLEACESVMEHSCSPSFPTIQVDQQQGKRAAQGVIPPVIQQQQSPELTVFTQHLPTIRTGILHGVQHDIAHKAYAQGLISKAVHRHVTGALNRLTPDERTDIFMDELETRIGIDAVVLTKFVDILKSSDSAYYEALVAKITEALGAAVSPGPLQSPGPSPKGT